MDQIEALRAAAGALIATAAMPVVVSVLRQLLDDVETPALTPAAAKPAASAPPVSPSPTDTTWAELRQRLRAAKAERGIGDAELATAIGAAKMTVRKAVSSNRSPTKAMRAKLEVWLAEPVQAPEVAAAAVAFRPNGHHAAYVGAANGRNHRQHLIRAPQILTQTQNRLVAAGKPGLAVTKLPCAVMPRSRRDGRGARVTCDNGP